MKVLAIIGVCVVAQVAIAIAVGRFLSRRQPGATPGVGEARVRKLRRQHPPKNAA